MLGCGRSRDDVECFEFKNGIWDKNTLNVLSSSCRRDSRKK